MSLRALGRFFAIGAVLFVAKSALPRLVPRERPVVEVFVPDGAPDAEARARIDEAILVEEGLRFGWAATDPVIRQRLAADIAFVDAADPPGTDAVADAEGVQQALAVGMERTDPVVRRRLVYRVREVLRTPGPEDVVSDEALLAHLRAHPERFSRPARLTLVHVFLARERRATEEALWADATSLLERLRAEHASPEAAIATSDPIPLLAPRQSTSVTSLDRLFGHGFGTRVASLGTGAWDGPVESAYGLHLVLVERREGARLPSVESVRGRVEADYLDEARERRVAGRMVELRQRYDVRVVRGRGDT